MKPDGLENPRVRDSDCLRKKATAGTDTNPRKSFSSLGDQVATHRSDIVHPSICHIHSRP